MAKADFFGTWIVEWTNPGPKSSTLCVYPDPVSLGKGNGVLIHYNHFVPEYPTFQNAYYDPGKDTISGMMSRDRKIEMSLQGGQLSAVTSTLGSAGDTENPWTAHTA